MAAIRSEFGYELLNGENYDNWSSLLKNHLVAQGLWGVLFQNPPSDNSKNNWERRNAGALDAILKSCTPEVLSQISNNSKGSAKDVWNFLSKSFGETLLTIEVDIEQGQVGIPFLECIESGEWSEALGMIQDDPMVLYRTSDSGRTALHIATIARRENIVKILIDIMPVELLRKQDNDGYTALALAAKRHVYPDDIAKYMVEKDKTLLTIETSNYAKFIPVVLAAREGLQHMARYLYSETPKSFFFGRHGALLLSASISTKLFDIALHLLMESNLVPITLAKNDVAFHPLYELVKKPSTFPSGSKLSFLQRQIYKCIYYDLDGNPLNIKIPSSSSSNQEKSRSTNDFWTGDSIHCRSPFDKKRRFDIAPKGGLYHLGRFCQKFGSLLGKLVWGVFSVLVAIIGFVMMILLFLIGLLLWAINSLLSITGILWIMEKASQSGVWIIARIFGVIGYVPALLWGRDIGKKTYMALLMISLKVPGMKHIYDQKLTHYWVLEITKLMSDKVKEINGNQEIQKTKVYEAMLVAAKNGTIEFIVSMTNANPDLFFVCDKYKRDIFSHAILNGREKVFKLINTIPAGRREAITSRKDLYQNNVLHMAGKLSPTHQLNRSAGAAMQMQREFQWYKAVKKAVPPRLKDALNVKGMKPREVFRDEHQELMKEAEKWAKGAASSYIIVGTLIITIMFAAAFTVPGGNNEETGIPIFTGSVTLSVFIIADAISLFSSATSVLVFTGILTSRYAENDFLFHLPKKLLIGLLALFLSIVTMMIAFCAAITIILRRYVLIVAAAIALATVSFITFVPSQLRLFADIYISTYRSEFSS